MHRANKQLDSYGYSYGACLYFYSACPNPDTETRLHCTDCFIRSVLISWEALTNGRVSWNVTLDRPTLPLPVVDMSGDVLLSNGYKLLGFTAEGKSYGKPILLYPIHGHVMDLSISSEQFLILLYKCGFFAVYITSKYYIILYTVRA